MSFIGAIKMIDLHCHILHGLDDGAKNLDEAVEMANMAEKDGIKTIVATPHLFRGDFIPKDLGIIQKKIDELMSILEKKNIDVKIVKGAEVHIAHNLMDEIRKNRNYLVLNGSSYMFLEFPAGHVFSDVKELLFELMTEGCRPIIAHPERNYVFMRSPDILFELLQMGALTQANSGSFIGLYGRRVEEAAVRFLELRFTHFLGSDAHNPRLPHRWLSEAVSTFEESIGKEAANALVYDNPHAVLNDNELPYLPDPIDPTEKERSFKVKIPRLFKR
jgi:protein-tyrosine phosphatase